MKEDADKRLLTSVMHRKEVTILREINVTESQWHQLTIAKRMTFPFSPLFSPGRLRFSV
jgi:hypothetical protein